MALRVDFADRVNAMEVLRFQCSPNSKLHCRYLPALLLTGRRVLNENASNIDSKKASSLDRYLEASAVSRKFWRNNTIREPSRSNRRNFKPQAAEQRCLNVTLFAQEAASPIAPQSPLLADQSCTCAANVSISGSAPSSPAQAPLPCTHMSDPLVDSVQTQSRSHSAAQTACW